MLGDLFILMKAYESAWWIQNIKSPDYSSALTYKVFSISNKLYTQDPLVKWFSK